MILVEQQIRQLIKVKFDNRIIVENSIGLQIREKQSKRFTSYYCKVLINKSELVNIEQVRKEQNVRL